MLNFEFMSLLKIKKCSVDIYFTNEENGAHRSRIQIRKPVRRAKILPRKSGSINHAQTYIIFLRNSKMILCSKLKLITPIQAKFFFKWDCLWLKIYIQNHNLFYELSNCSYLEIIWTIAQSLNIIQNRQMYIYYLIYIHLDLYTWSFIYIWNQFKSFFDLLLHWNNCSYLLAIYELCLNVCFKKKYV